MQTPERVRFVLFDKNGPMTPQTKNTIRESAKNSGKAKDYTDNAVFYDQHGNMIPNTSANNQNAIAPSTPQKNNNNLNNPATPILNTTSSSPTQAVTTTPGQHVLPNKQKVVIKKDNKVREVTLFTEEKTVKKIPEPIIVTTEDIKKAEKLSKGDKENLPFGPLDIGSMPLIPIKKRKHNISQTDLMGLSAAKLMAITILETQLEEGLAKKTGLIKKKLNEYPDQELEKLCTTADIRINGQWLHSVAYSLGDGTPNGNTQVRNNLSAGDFVVNDRMKTAEEIARDLRASEKLKGLQYSADVRLKKRKVDSPSVFRQEGEEYTQILSYAGTSILFKHDPSNKNRRTKAHRAVLTPLVNTYFRSKII